MTKAKWLSVALIGLVACILVACHMAQEPMPPQPSSSALIISATKTVTNISGDGRRLTVVPAGATVTPLHSKDRPLVSATTIAASINPTDTSVLLPGWESYERALVQAVLPNNIASRAVCEWKVLGCAQLERYIWAYCIGYLVDTGGETGASLPAVLDFTEDGGLVGVRIPGEGSDYSRDVALMFPSTIQWKIQGEPHEQLVQSLAQHAHERLKDPELLPLAAGAPECP